MTDMVVPACACGFAHGLEKESLIASSTTLAPYAKLQKVLVRAFLHAAEGKGAARHAIPGVPFESQPICEIGLNLGSNHFEIGQAVKKAIESIRLPGEAGVAELLGAINYLAAAVLVREKLDPQETHRGG